MRSFIKGHCSSALIVLGMTVGSDVIAGPIGEQDGDLQARQRIQRAISAIEKMGWTVNVCAG